VAAFGTYVRFAGLPDVFCRSPDELAEVMPGLRLHVLPLLNVRDPVRYNFIQSMFYSNHGLGDVSFYYLASGALSLLGLPISERFLFLAGGVTNIGLALAGGILGARLLRSAGTGWVFAMLVLVSPFYVFVSKSGWARLTWTPLLVVLLFLCQQKAMRDRGVVWPAVFCALAGFTSLTDGFVIFPILVVLGLLMTDGGPADRVRRLVGDRVFLSGFLAFALGIGLDLLIGLGARRRGTDLTMMAYVMLRGGHGALVPSREALAVWAQSVDWYFPFRGAWLVVTTAFALAVLDGLRGGMAGLVAAWWLLASVGVLRYSAGQSNIGHASDLGWLNAYHLAAPSLLLVAWLIASIAEGRLPIAGRLWPSARGALAVALLVPLVTLMAGQAQVVAFAAVPVPGLTSEQLAHDVGPGLRLSACRTVKAASFYVRSHETGLPYVFQLSSQVALGHFGEFYYGLSYGGSLRQDDLNHLLDFGGHQFGRQYPPEAFYRAYGVRQFDYYVDFADDPNPFKVLAVNRLLGEGARVVCTIRDGGRPIGRILSFRDERPVDLDYRTAAQSWDRMFAHPWTLLLQPLAGTAYHFGYSWRSPE